MILVPFFQSKRARGVPHLKVAKVAITSRLLLLLRLLDRSKVEGALQTSSRFGLRSAEEGIDEDGIDLERRLLGWVGLGLTRFT